MTDEEKIEHLRNTITEIDERISYLNGEIWELQASKTKCIDELRELGCDLETDVLYYPESGCIIM